MTDFALDAAWKRVQTELPYKRWTVWLSGDWENGWVASATSRPAGEAGITVTTVEPVWGYPTIGVATPAAALNALADALASRDSTTEGET